MKNTITLLDGRRMVCRIFDTGHDGPMDRYTVAFKGYRPYHGQIVYPYIASSDHPFHPQGFGQHGESHQFMTGKGLGKRVSFESIPDDVKRFILDQFKPL